MLSVFVSESSFHVLAYKAQRQEVAHCFYFIDSLCSVEQYAHRLLVAFLYFNNHLPAGATWGDRLCCQVSACVACSDGDCLDWLVRVL